jgi:uncharacterized protein (DUF362 family)
MKRREFIKQSTAGAAAVELARRFPALAADKTAKVALVRSEDRLKGISAALKLISFASPDKKRVLIKPNFNTADPAPGSTHNDTLRQLVLEMKARGASHLAIGDSCGPGTTKAVIEAKGVPALAQELGFDVINFDDLPAEGWVHCNPPGSHWSKGFDVAKPVVDAEYLVWTCCLKTHAYGGVHSMSLKLAVGVTRRSVRGEMHAAMNTHMRRMIAEIHQGFRPPHLIVMDAVDIFVDGGPMEGKRAKPGVILAGADRIAMDAVGLAVLKNHGANDAIMSKKIFEQEQLQRAVELGLGIKGPHQIEILTGEPESSAYAASLKPILAEG